MNELAAIDRRLYRMRGTLAVIDGHVGLIGGSVLAGERVVDRAATKKAVLFLDRAAELTHLVERVLVVGARNTGRRGVRQKGK